MAINLADLMPPVRQIDTGNGMLPVRGLSISAIAQLTTQYGPALAPYLAGATVDVPKLVAECPDLVAGLICAATDSAGQEEQAKLFPVWLQVEIITAVWEESVPDLKKLVGLLSGVISKLKKEAPAPVLVSTNMSAPG